MNEQRLALFLAVLRIELEKNVKDHPDHYAWSLNNIDTVFMRIADAVKRDNFDKETISFKNTCKAFGLDHTYKAIRGFLNGVDNETIKK
jgi:hypothetical protein